MRLKFLKVALALVLLCGAPLAQATKWTEIGRFDDMWMGWSRVYLDTDSVSESGEWVSYTYKIFYEEDSKEKIHTGRGSCNTFKVTSIDGKSQTSDSVWLLDLMPVYWICDWGWF